MISKKSGMNRKLNNAGMTLMEVLVSVILLSLAIGPLLYTFVYSTVFNMKARERQRATNAAQSIMEQIKADSLETVNLAFTDSAISFLENNSATYNPPASGLFGDYLINNMSFSDATGVHEETIRYDAIVTITEVSPEEQAGSNVEIYDSKQDCLYAAYTDPVDGLNMYNNNPYYSAVAGIVQSEKGLLDNLKDPTSGMYNAGYLNSYISEIKITREIYVDVVPSGSGTKVNVRYEFPYTVTYNLGSVPALPGGATRRVVSTTIGVYDNPDNVIRNFYFYYFPAYDISDVSAGAGLSASAKVHVVNDVLVFSNASGNDNMKLFLYKQKDATVSQFVLPSLESAYKLTIKPGTGTNKTTVSHNINIDLSGTNPAGFSGHFINGDVNAGDPFRALFSEKTEYLEKSNISLSYDVAIRIFDASEGGASSHGSDEPLAVLNGSVVGINEN